MEKALEGKQISCPVGTQPGKGARARVCLAKRPVWVELSKKGLVWEEMKSERSPITWSLTRHFKNLGFSRNKMGHFQGYYAEE